MEWVELYRRMSLARAFELALKDLWDRGWISGEMHLGTGEEGIIAGVQAHMRRGDAVALDHRPTPMLTLLGVDLGAMVREMLGSEDGLCGGWGGHMHLFAPDRLAASSGIVGASAPTAVGLALAGKLLRPGSVAVATFGDGAFNQGMLLESLNLAVSWSLPVIFVCKDNGWAITTRSDRVTGGDIPRRAGAFGLSTFEADGGDAMEVWSVASQAFEQARSGEGPCFLYATCPRHDGHMLGDVLVQTARKPGSEGTPDLGQLLSSALSKDGGGVLRRAASVTKVTGLLLQARGDRREGARDPLIRARKRMDGTLGSELDRIDRDSRERVQRAVDEALAEEAK
jgi:pyruvate dehydrogenase E1 component alpha subunit